MPTDIRDVGEIGISDADVVHAMTRIPGYLDISPQDFRLLYHEAHRHAVDRLMGEMRVEALMRTNLPALTTDMTMDQAIRTIVACGLSGLPVAAGNGTIIGMLTETDFLRCFEADTFLELMLCLISDKADLKRRCRQTSVAEAMSTPIVSIEATAGFREALAAFRRHAGRSMPVVDRQGALIGLLLRKDFLMALESGVLA